MGLICLSSEFEKFDVFDEAHEMSKERNAASTCLPDCLSQRGSWRDDVRSTCINHVTYLVTGFNVKFIFSVLSY